MSLVHWDKSVLTFHLKEIIEDHQAGDSTALVGLGTILLGTTILPAAVKLGRPILKAIIKAGLSLHAESKASFPQPAIKRLPTSIKRKVNPVKPLTVRVGATKFDSTIAPVVSERKISDSKSI